jgi:all-trans-8'-apo-beta-carotenal 15,15'-oxygenase
MRSGLLNSIMTQPTSFPAWAKAIPQTNLNKATHPVMEFAPTLLPVVSGAVPEGLRGSLYRNGPAKLQRGNQRVGHWFDGDGAILGVHFADGGAVGTYRFVQTAGYQAEEEEGKFLFGGYGMTAPVPIWQRFRQEMKNAANTSVLALPDRLLALWEGGHPHALDLQTLETIRLDDLGGLAKDVPYSAHPKRDLQTGEIFNFGVTYGKIGILHVYRSDRTGKIQQQAKIELNILPLIHDFVLAGQYLIFFIPPVTLNPVPLLLLAKLKSYSDALSWQPKQGTQILVLDRETLTVVSRGETEPWFQWHFSNGYIDDDGTVKVEVIRYADFQTNQYLKQAATGKTDILASGKLWQIRLDPQTGNVHEASKFLDRTCEFPSIKPQDVGHTWQKTYLSIHRRDADPKREMFGAIACFDQQTGDLMEADLGENRYPTEPIYAPDVQDHDRGWILTVVFDGNSNRSEVWIFNSDYLSDEPVCRLALPQVIPLGFHGTWKPM